MDINKIFYEELKKVVLDSLIDRDIVRYMINDLNEKERYEIFEGMMEQLKKEGKKKETEEYFMDEDYFMNDGADERLLGYFKKYIKEEVDKDQEKD